MSDFTQPTKARIRRFTVNGADLLSKNMVNRIQVYETILKPYLTAVVTLYDSDNIINSLGLVGGETVNFAFDGNRDIVYEQKMKILKIHAPSQSQNLRTQIYTIDLIGDEYYRDEANLVQQSFKNIPGTNVIANIHKKFISSDTPLKILSASLGALAKESHIISSVKPFKAINDIKKKLNYATVKTGNTLYFRDAQQHVLGPLEQLFSELSSQQEFFQKNTWGSSFRDLATVENAIIGVAIQIEEGRGGMQKVSAVRNQEKTVFDFQTKKMIIKKLSSAIQPGKLVGNVLGLGQEIFKDIGKHGGVANYLTMDAANIPASQDGSNKTEAERLYAALAQSGPCVTVKVPIQSGMRCTVGKGVKLNLLPPTGDLNTGRNNISGMYLVHSLCHDLKADDRMVNATTTMTCYRGGYD